MTGTVPTRVLDQERVRGSKVEVFLDEKERAQLQELERWFNCSRSEAARMAIRYTFTVRAKYGS